MSTIHDIYSSLVEANEKGAKGPIALPVMLILRRVGIRSIGGKQIGLYYSTQLDRYVTLPDRVIGGLNESVETPPEHQQMKEDLQSFVSYYDDGQMTLEEMEDVLEDYNIYDPDGLLTERGSRNTQSQAEVRARKAANAEKAISGGRNKPTRQTTPTKPATAKKPAPAVAPKPKVANDNGRAAAGRNANDNKPVNKLEKARQDSQIQRNPGLMDRVKSLAKSTAKGLLKKAGGAASAVLSADPAGEGSDKPTKVAPQAKGKMPKAEKALSDKKKQAERPDNNSAEPRTGKSGDDAADINQIKADRKRQAAAKLASDTRTVQNAMDKQKKTASVKAAADAKRKREADARADAKAEAQKMSREKEVEAKAETKAKDEKAASLKTAKRNFKTPVDQARDLIKRRDAPRATGPYPDGKTVKPTKTAGERDQDRKTDQAAAKIWNDDTVRRNKAKSKKRVADYKNTPRNSGPYTEPKPSKPEIETGPKTSPKKAVSNKFGPFDRTNFAKAAGLAALATVGKGAYDSYKNRRGGNDDDNDDDDDHKLQAHGANDRADLPDDTEGGTSAKDLSKKSADRLDKHKEKVRRQAERSRKLNSSYELQPLDRLFEMTAPNKTLKQLRTMMENNEIMEHSFDDGTVIPVDKAVVTSMVTLYEELSEENKEIFLECIKNQDGFVLIADFAINR